MIGGDTDRHAVIYRKRWGVPGAGFSPVEVMLVSFQSRILTADTRENARWAVIDLVFGDRRQGIGMSKLPSDYLIFCDGGPQDVDAINATMQEMRYACCEIGPSLGQVLDDSDRPYEPGRIYPGDVVVTTGLTRSPIGSPDTEAGSIALIEAFREDGGVMLRVGDELGALGPDLRRCLRLGYAQPLSAARAGVAERTYILSSGASLGDAAMLMSSAWADCTIITDMQSLDHDGDADILRHILVP